MEKRTSRVTASIPRSEMEAWLVLSRLPGIGDQKIAVLVQKFGHPETVLHESPESLSELLGVSLRQMNSAIQSAQSPLLRKQIDILLNGDFRLYTLWDDDYPAMLRNIHTPPVMLFTRGEVLEEDHRSVAIVGARSATEYGKRIAYDLGYGLGSMGLTVVSGLARGIDSFAHKGALDAGGRTLAVLGCGPDLAYPPENRSLMESIVHSGAVISEFPPGTTPNPRHFPRRNRVIAGLSLGVVVVQASMKSGALITASRALEQGKEVMAVPGPVNARVSKGPHSLIKQGAALVEDPDDVLAALGEPLITQQPPKHIDLPKLAAEEQDLLTIMGTDPVHIDTLCNLTGHPSGILLARLLELELKGVVKQLAGKQFLSLVDIG